jgi:hypothetical protein
MVDLLLVLIHCFRLSIRGAPRFLCMKQQITLAAEESRGARPLLKAAMLERP